ncbi:MAG: hypothetical protein PHU26_06235 [Methanofollis liminatans]|nr:hypothetical protein [Methanofollis liminatans]
MEEIISGAPIKGCLYRAGWQECFPSGENRGKCCCRERGQRTGSVGRPAPAGKISGAPDKTNTPYIGVRFVTGFPGLIVAIYGIYDVYKTAKRMNAGEIPYRATNVLHMILFVFFWFFGIAALFFLGAIVAGLIFGAS